MNNVRLTASEEAKAIEYFEKLGAILNVLDCCQLQDADRAALSWAALDYHDLLGGVIGLTAKKQS